jgi:hypothetical protein
MKKLTTMIDDATSATITRELEKRGWSKRKTGRLIDEAISKLAAWEETPEHSVTITRLSKLGFGYCARTPERQESPSRPDHSGSYQAINEAIEADLTYQSMRSDGTDMAMAWFVETPSGWRRIVSSDWQYSLNADGTVVVSTE